MSGPSLFGRSAELDTVRALTGPGDGHAPGRGLVVLGEAGIGKSAVLADLLGYAQARGWCVLNGAGRERETGIAFAGLRQLVRPILTELLSMPGPYAEELRAAIGMVMPTSPPARSLAGTALGELLSRHAARHAGVLLIVDDAHWMDASSLETLAFAAHSLSAGPVAMVFAARGEVPPAGLDEDIAQLVFTPLSITDANELLDAQPYPPRGRVRAHILAQAAGNPMALVELSRAVADEIDERPYPAGLPLPLTDKLSTAFAAQLRDLPDRTRRALLLIAACDGKDVAAAIREARDLDPTVLAPAEEGGVITVTARGARFRHPLARSAVYYAATFADRAGAHRELADVLRDEPDRRAWHLGAAVCRPDETIASLLATTAPDAKQRAGAAAAGLALERAAELTPDRELQTTRLIMAAETASSDGQFEWAYDLAARALALPGPESLRSRARLVAGRALAWAGRPTRAAATLMPLARETARYDANIAWNALATAATASYQAGQPHDVRLVADTLTEMPPPTDEGTRAAQIWALAVTGQAHGADIAPWLRTDMAGNAESQAHAGAAAWLVDRTGDAITLLEAAREAMSAASAGAAVEGSLAALGWAYIDAGRWQEARGLAAPSGSTTSTGLADSTRHLLMATVEAACGRTGEARRLVAAALAADTENSGQLTARARHALGLCALADGDYEGAFDHLRGLYTAGGVPCHYHASYLAVGDLAIAAARSGNRVEGQALLKRIRSVLESTLPRPSERVRELFARADSVLADPADPNAYQPAALADRADGSWPFERARFQLEAGEWLRRRRRINEAKPLLRAALDAFHALGATPWKRQAEAELRACGVTVPGTLADSRRLRDLTPQQRRILGLAAEGLTNREIAQRLFLSPKTVASHLYHSFPVLGVAERHQLRALFAQPQPQT
ncbi:AAA family ATPase [Streptomyces sp. NPDC059629]|uniref:helix-turn-helix transcriptional regulator n=1 Tax=Streptomyces sp. NPDC059629 TaxID=3346889 RepID=UPI0036C9A1BF